ncbi:hypothetical protein CPB85DRAFT_1379000 [Mucidula mucida]|nr:hypothetical protein CPB85DRAFT_1379000 [Mucidula mucida]
MTARKPYNGSRRKLVIAFDIGTTYSGVSFSILDPGIPPVIQGVHKFPAQQEVGGAKIPSVIYYDNEGNVRAIGAEAVDNAFQDETEDEGYYQGGMVQAPSPPEDPARKSSHRCRHPPLPAGKRVVDVFADFMRYLFQCTKEYIINMSPTGLLFWSSIEEQYRLRAQQAIMRQAAVLGGLVDDENAQERVQFVTEGEASLHYCIAKGAFNGSQTLKKGVVIVDAGGGTIDLSAYRKQPSGGYEEIAPTQCHLQGSIFVTRRCRVHIEKVLEGTRFGNPDDLSHITDTFDKSTKMSFRSATTSLFIRFGSVRDREPRAGISNGRMKLDGAVVERFFEPSLSTIVEGVRAQMRDATTPITTVVIVGGFSANEWLFSDQVTVCRPDGFV